VPAVEVTLPEQRSLEAIAIENAAEGCVRETWGAVIALWQTNTAADPEVRAVFAQIAKDEARHAALAWAVDEWVRPLLDDDARARVDAAREAAAQELFSNPGEALAALGLLARARHSLWTGGLS
jgi:hypothetical protein